MIWGERFELFHQLHMTRRMLRRIQCHAQLVPELLLAYRLLCLHLQRADLTTSLCQIAIVNVRLKVLILMNNCKLLDTLPTHRPLLARRLSEAAREVVGDIREAFA